MNTQLNVTARTLSDSEDSSSEEDIAAEAKQLHQESERNTANFARAPPTGAGNESTYNCSFGRHELFARRELDLAKLDYKQQ